jgi:hypothetical protein
MEEQIFPVSINPEIDRVDAIFTVATGPIGRQEVNYHIIDDEQDRRTIRQSLPYIQPINQSPKEKSLLKSRRTIELIDPKILNNFSVSTKEIQSKTSDDYNRRARFSLPEIDSSNQQEKTYQIKKGIKIFVENFYVKYSSK